MGLQQLSWLLKKELRSAIRSRWLILGFVLIPLFNWSLQAFIQGFIARSMTTGALTVYVTNEDEGDLGTILHQWIVNSSSELNLGAIVEITNSHGFNMVEEGNMTVWIVIPPDFTSNLTREQETTLVVYVDSGSMLASGTAHRIEMFAKSKIDEYTQQLHINEKAIREEATFGLILATFLIPFLTVIAPAPFIAESFAGEREKKTLEALIALPMSRLAILFGKFLSALAMVAIYGVSTIFGMVLYNEMIHILAGESAALMAAEYTISLSVMPMIAVSVILLSLCAIAIGIVISSMAKDQKTAASYIQMVLMVPTMLVGVLAFTGTLQTLSGVLGMVIKIIPFSHAILFMNGILISEAPLIDLIINILYLLGATIVFLAIGAKLFQRETIID
jgi:sodium transport system permease protein